MNLVQDSRNAATSVTASYRATGKGILVDDSDSWKYPLHPSRAGDGLLVGAGAGASTSTGMCDGEDPKVGAGNRVDSNYTKGSTMPVIHTVSATPLERVTIEPSASGGAHVWLRTNITESQVEVEGVTTITWEADEIYLWHTKAPNMRDVETEFDLLWARASATDDFDTWKSDVNAALAELAEN